MNGEGSSPRGLLQQIMTERDLGIYRELAMSLMYARMWRHLHPSSSHVALFTAPSIALCWSADLVKAAGLDDVMYLFPYGRPLGGDNPLPLEARKKICMVDRPQDCPGLLEFLAASGELVVLLVEDQYLSRLVSMGLSGKVWRRRFRAGLVTFDEFNERMEPV